MRTERVCQKRPMNPAGVLRPLWSSVYLFLLVVISFSKDDCQVMVWANKAPSSIATHGGNSLTKRRRIHRHGQRSLVMFGTMEGWIQRQHQERYRDITAIQMASSSVAPLPAVTYKPPPLDDDEDEDEDKLHEEGEEEYQKNNDGTGDNRYYRSKSITSAVADTEGNHPTKRNKMWPPWPFNLLQRSEFSTSAQGNNMEISPRRQGPVVRMGSYLFTFFGQRARVSFKELQDVGSRLWFHLPPMTPPLLLMTLLPRQESQIITSAETGIDAVISRTVIPLWSNPLARTLVLTGFSLAIMSWAHSELNRLRKLTPLPLNYAYRDIHSAVLPHALPEEVPEPFLLDDVGDDDEEEEHNNDNQLQDGSRTGGLFKEATVGNAEDDSQSNISPSSAPQSSSSISQKLAASVPPSLQRHFKQFGRTSNGASNSDGGSSEDGKSKRRFQGWRKNMKYMRNVRRAEAQKVRRMAIYDELVALQAIKRKAKQQGQGPKSSRKNGKSKANIGEEPLGYALVTGASRGIGRAIAVELARWDIPLILVARDLSRLTSLAYDLEACYGIKCCVLQADLAEPHAAEQIHQATQQAGLTVDILVNNAGISSSGLAVDMSLQDVDRMIRVNGLAVAHLAHLYGKDMKERRRGRMLVVSSVVGAVAAGPTVATYAATKAFEKTLGLSLAKELEPYGVGVTLLMPGAVKDTDFRSSSSVHEALCWKLPGYPKSPSTVARVGVRAMLTGDVEVTPGWQNRAFLKVFQPALPQRLHNILVEMAWTPPYVPPSLKFWKTAEKRQRERQKQLEGRNKQHVEDDGVGTYQKNSPQQWRPRSNTYLPPPLLLTIPGEVESPSPPETSDKGVPRIDQSLLVGPEPTVDAQQSNTTSDGKPQTSNEEPDSSSIDETTEEDPYRILRKLSNDLDSPTIMGGDNSSVDHLPDQTEPSESTGVLTESPETQQQQQQQTPPDRQVLQLQEQVLKLQQEVLRQEREQFLQQIELERRKRELEYEKRVIKLERERQEEKARNSIERERQEEDERNLERERRKTLGWQKRNAKRSTDSPTDNMEGVPANPTPPPTTKPSTPKQGRPPQRDLMSESMEHPLFAP